MNCKLIELPKIIDPRGNLTFLQNFHQVPFKIQRVFWTYDVPGGEIRGGHAYHNQEEIIIALSGSFEIVITNIDGSKEKFQMNRSYFGLYLPALTWRHMENFSTNSVGLHLSSSAIQEQEYLRDFEIFRNL